MSLSACAPAGFPQPDASSRSSSTCWAAYCGMPYGVAVSNGTVALEAAVACLDLKPGDEVILPTFTIISCAQAVVYGGGVPVLVDADPQHLVHGRNQVAARITSRTRAIMPVHIYGHPVDMAPLWALAEQHGLTIIEDAAEAHGAIPMPRPALRWLGRSELLQLLCQQDHHHRRRRHDPDQGCQAGRAVPQPAQPLFPGPNAASITPSWATTSG